MRNGRRQWTGQRRRAVATDPLRIAALMTEALPSPDSPKWAAEMRQVITRGHMAAWMAGTAERLGVKPDSPLLSKARLSKAERAEIKKTVDKQLDYLKQFSQAKGEMSEAQITARADLYPGAVKTTYYEARWGDWDIPADLLPGNQQCITRCLCRGHVRDNGDGTGVWIRELGGTEQHCTECPPLAGEHPIERRGAATKAQTAQERAMFANMGSSPGSGAPGGGPATGGQGGLWAKGPDGKRTPQAGTDAANVGVKDATPTDGSVPVTPRTSTELNQHLIDTNTIGHVSEAEQRSIDRYVLDGFAPANKALRGLSDDPTDALVAKNITSGLDPVMRRSGLADNIQVHRGMEVWKEDAAGHEHLARMQPGAILKEPGYLSVSIDPEEIRRFGGGEQEPRSWVTNVTMHVTVRAGTRAAYMPAVRPNFEGSHREKELVIDRGATYRVNKRTEHNGRVELEVEVMGHDD